MNALRAYLAAENAPEFASPGDREQFEVLLEAYENYLERNAKYKDLWKLGGARDSSRNIESKAARLVEIGTDDPSDLDDAIDLINYAAFFIRNMRENRIWGSRAPGSILAEASGDIRAGELVLVDLTSGEVHAHRG